MHDLSKNIITVDGKSFQIIKREDGVCGPAVVCTFLPDNQKEPPNPYDLDLFRLYLNTLESYTLSVLELTNKLISYPKVKPIITGGSTTQVICCEDGPLDKPCIFYLDDILPIRAGRKVNICLYRTGSDGSTPPTYFVSPYGGKVTFSRTGERVQYFAVDRALYSQVDLITGVHDQLTIIGAY